jgi:toxin ParE1/3/4
VVRGPRLARAAALSVRVLFRDSASEDVHQAKNWYDERQKGLGARFTDSLRLVVALISEHPLACAVVYRGLRRALLPGFPYALFYLVGEDCLRVVACLHQHRGPQAIEERARDLGDV